MLHRSISYRLIVGLGAGALAVLLFVAAMSAGGPTAPGLGAASSYAVLGGSAVTNTGSTITDGDVGVWPNVAIDAITGFPPGIANGTIHRGDENARLAQDDVTTAYNALAAEPCTEDLTTDPELGGKTLTEGVYCFSSSAQLTGQLTLDAQGSADAVFIFQIGSTLTTASNSSILVTNGGVGCNVFWQVGSSATIGTGTVFVGNILALTSITLTTGASVSGRGLARNGAVTMDTNHVGFSGCAAPTATASPTASPTASATVTPSPTDTATATATPTAAATPTPTATPVGQTPTPTATPVGQTPTPTPTATPVGQTPTPTLTATPAGPHFPPNTGGPPQQGGRPWIPLLLGLALSSLAATTFVLSRRGNSG
jgi:hypothetical protein